MGRRLQFYVGWSQGDLTEKRKCEQRTKGCGGKKPREHVGEACCRPRRLLHTWNPSQGACYYLSNVPSHCSAPPSPYSNQTLAFLPLLRYMLVNGGWGTTEVMRTWRSSSEKLFSQIDRQAIITWVKGILGKQTLLLSSTFQQSSLQRWECSLAVLFNK